VERSIVEHIAYSVRFGHSSPAGTIEHLSDRGHEGTLLFSMFMTKRPHSSRTKISFAIDTAPIALGHLILIPTETSTAS
jgi:hypothetical protein